MARFRQRQSFISNTSLFSRLSCIFLVLALFSLQTSGQTGRLVLSPKLYAGQKFAYWIRFQSDKNTKTQSNVVAPMAPTAAQQDANVLLQVEILDVQRSGGKATIHAKAYFEKDDAFESQSSASQNIGSTVTQDTADQKFMEFTILPSGRVKTVKGLNVFSSEQQQSWQEWVSLFAMAGIFPEGGVKLGEKWKTEQVERSPSPIAGLEWAKETTYVKNELCRATPLPNNDTAESTPPPEICAVILTTAALKQKSSTKDATPEDYKLHELRTLGTASGTNETIAYISLKTGLVVRATQEAAQSLDVTIVKTDGSNRVHYNIDAKGRTEVLLAADAKPQNP